MRIRTNAIVSTAKRHSGARGFTLLELMITVGIVAILASLALPSYQQHIIRGRRATAKAAMMDLANREQQLLIANRAYLDATALAGYSPGSEVTPYYDWTVTVNNVATPPTFLITFTPKSGGAQSSDGALTLDNLGTKSPAAKWSR